MKNNYWTYPAIVAVTLLLLAVFGLLNWTPALWGGAVTAIAAAATFVAEKRSDKQPR